ncbi:MAG: hypothetical protein A3F72_08900 [Bacteroidetes bacterium RIFCSPLOWO2_12_FULL_35_15]|nr:MAG: hypothetical protein A3F72_08900 [Bacteroidetes bacterium RIFCSPLOWO2_12_FULL_35_15]
MNKHIEKIKKQALDEAMKTGLVLIGAVSGTLAIKGIRKFTEEHPTMDAVAEYALPLLFAGGGIIIAAATDANSKAKYFGYGLAVAGGFEGIKIIPVAKDYLSGILGETEIPAASAFYTESEEREKLMNGFGLSALPVGNASMQEVASIQSNLPDLEGAENIGNEDLGYNASQTDDEEIKGIL